MTVEATPLVAENTIAPVSAFQCRFPRRSDQPVQTSTTGSPSRYTASAPPPKRRHGNICAKARTAQREIRVGSALHATWQGTAVATGGIAALRSQMLTTVTLNLLRSAAKKPVLPIC